MSAGRATPRPRLVLVGAPGAGKSTVGQEVARRLGVGFRDTDSDVETATGETIGEIFVVRGEPAFRSLEVDAVATALAEHDGVLALGGGAVLDERTRAALRGHRVVWLVVSGAEAFKRVGMSTARPVLAVNPRSTLGVLLKQRRPFYEEVATARVETDSRPTDDVVAEVLALAGGASG